MKFLGVLILPLLFVSCNGDTYESLSDEMLDAFDEVNTIMTTIQDPESGKKAGVRLNELSKRFYDITVRMKDLGDVAKKIDENYLKERAVELGDRFIQFSKEIRRVKNIEGAEEVFATLQSFKHSLLFLDNK